jgi:hypothetical protein
MLVIEHIDGAAIHQGKEVYVEFGLAAASRFIVRAVLPELLDRPLASVSVSVATGDPIFPSPKKTKL